MTRKRLVTPRESMLQRRRMLEGLGALSIAAYLPACGSDDDAGAPSGDGSAGAAGSGDTPGIGNMPGANAAGSGGQGGSAGASPDETTCTLTPEQTEGPFFFDTGFARSDIREDKSGAELRLSLRVVGSDGCSPIAGAVVEVWHADADGAYSAFDSAQGNSADAAGETFLRGYQTSDAEGRVEFVTVYPGWYPGRTPHIHLMVLVNGQERMTSQLYFPEATTDEVYEQAPYSARGERTTSNASDGVGVPAALIGSVTRSGAAYATAFRLVVPR
ncbi:MAG: intradiol ring-cleavage dioxygenase [Polyangiaceae bacterium]